MLDWCRFAGKKIGQSRQSVLLCLKVETPNFRCKTKPNTIERPFIPVQSVLRPELPEMRGNVKRRAKSPSWGAIDVNRCGATISE